MFTIKLKIKQIDSDLEPYFKEYGKLKRICYNKLIDGESLTNVVKNLSSEINTFFDRSIIGYIGLDAQDIYNKHKDKKIVFGGKKNLEKLNKKLISKEEWKQLRNSYFSILGSSHDPNGNRKFKSDVINNIFYFCPNRNTKIKIEVENYKSYKDKLLKIEELSKIGLCPITYKVTRTHLLITIEEKNLIDSTKRIERIKQRIASIDLNPNYIGLVICDYNLENNQTIIFKQIYDLTKLNDKHNTNKTKHELCDVCHDILKKLNHYKVESFCIEKLNIQSKNHNKGKKYNRLINNTWNRNLVINLLSKLCNLNEIRFVEILPEYSSLIGCINNDKEIDSVAAALEIGRRGNLYIRMYFSEDLTKGNIIFPVLNRDQLIRWKDEIGFDNVKTWKQLGSWFKKNSKHSYRVLLKDFKGNSLCFRYRHRKSLVDNFLY